MARILVVGPNPAWQKVLVFGVLKPGEVNRASHSLSMASGKGINTGKVLRRLGHEVTLLQIVGGLNGRRCLEGCAKLGIASLHLEVAEETRQCITLADGRGETTEIIEPFRISKPGAIAALLALLPADPDAFDGIALCGTVPDGAGEGLYAAILDRLRPRVSVMDAWQGLAASTLARTTCVKMNRTEFAALEKRLGADALTEPLFLLTDGGKAAAVQRGGSVLARICPPGLGSVANPIGAGDTVTAGVLHHLLEGLPPAEAFRRGLALGSASCLKFQPADYADGDYARLLPLTELLP
jgi:fructose-1-phosphate kinase PfkB-like protein